MGFIHDRLAGRDYQVDYLHAEDVPSRARAFRRFSFPWAIHRHAQRASADGHPYRLLNIHEPSALPSLLCRARPASPYIVLTTHGVEQRAWELALEERRRGRTGPGFKTRVVYPLSSLWQSRLGFIRADHVFCLNEDDRAFLVDRFHLDDRKITRIFPGADPGFAEASRGRDYTRARRLLFAGTWRKNKGIEDLVPAFSELRLACPHFELLVLGAGMSAETVLDAFPESVRPAVKVVSARSDAETAAVFASADLFLLPSLFEGTPLTLVEAMMSGLPIVTSNVCGMKDLIEHGRNGLLVPTRAPEAIVRAVRSLTDDASLRRALGLAAHDDARLRYTWDLAAERVRAVYARLLEDSARPEAMAS